MGTGGLGGYFGARLALGGRADVSFIARGAHLQALRADGLRIEGPQVMHLPQGLSTPTKPQQTQPQRPRRAPPRPRTP